MTIVGSFRRIAVAAAVAITTVLVMQPASAQPVRPNGYPITNVNLRAGPGTYYPPLLVVPVRSPIRILGCLGDYTWCDVIFQGNRGWMRSIYLQGWYRGYYYSLRDYAPRLGYPVVAFDVGGYWDENYRDRPFYRDRGRWGGSYGEGWADRASFYSRLAPYGDWIWLEGQYVWVPEDVGPQWRPYTIGRWAYTDRYGWMWVSREPFGWATYHYGRWGFSRRVGWFWVPGSRWAPAWVSWRQSNDYLAWAPLPPTPDEGLGISIRVGTIPDYYWQVVPDRDFLSDDLPDRIVRDKRRYDPILRDTRPLGNVTVVNNTTIVNNVVKVTHVEEKTRQKVVVHKVGRTKDERRAKQAKTDGAAIEIFQPGRDQAAETVAPPKPKAIEEVAKGSKTREQAAGAATTEELLVPQEIMKAPEAAAKAETPPPPPPAPAEGATAPAEEEAAPPPPPPPAPVAGEAAPPPPEEAAPPPPATEAPPPAETAPPPPPPAAEEAAPPPPPPPPAEEAVPPPPPAPAVEEAAPPPAEAAPPPPPLAPPAAGEVPPVEEVAPPPPAPPAEEPEVKKEEKPKFKKDRGEQPQLEESLPPAPPPPPPPMEAAPPQSQDMAPPPDEGAPRRKKGGKPKLKQDQGEEPMPEALPPPPPEDAAPPPRPNVEDQPNGQRQGKANKRKEKDKENGGPQQSCPEGTVPLEDGSCVTPQ
jgi:uncharacterized protein YraI